MTRRFDAVVAISLLAVVLAAPASSQVPAPIRPDLGRLAPGKGAQLFNRALTTQ